MKKPTLEKHHLAIHAGTFSVAAMIFNSHGEVLGKSFAEISQRNPEPGWSEVDAEDIWHATLQTSHEVITKAGLYADQIATASVVSERGAMLAWDRVSKEALTPIIPQHCARTNKIVDNWKRKKWDRQILKRTGLPLSGAYGAPKLVWLLENHPGLLARAKRHEVLCGGLDSWLLWKLTLGKVHATDCTNAACSMLFNVRSFKWDKGLLKKFKIPAQMLPEVKPSSSIFGKTEQQGALPGNIPIGAVAADQPAALLALAGLDRGLAKTSYDLNCHIMMNIGGRPKFSKMGFATTLACSDRRRATYILEGVVPKGGWALYWLRDSLRLIDSIQETSGIAESVGDSNNLYLVPEYLVQKGQVPGGILGLGPNVTKAHLVKGALESVAFLTHRAMNTVAKEGRTSVRSVFVDGPMSQNDFLLQFQANLSDVPIARTKLGETACLGVSYLAGLAVKQFKKIQGIHKLRPIDQHFRSKVSGRERKKLHAGWDSAVTKLAKK